MRRRGPSHAAPAADAVAAAAAHVPRVPELAQGSLAAGARPLAVLPGQALGAAAADLLQLLLHPPAWAAEEDNVFLKMCLLYCILLCILYYSLCECLCEHCFRGCTFHCMKWHKKWVFSICCAKTMVKMY